MIKVLRHREVHKVHEYAQQAHELCYLFVSLKADSLRPAVGMKVTVENYCIYLLLCRISLAPCLQLHPYGLL